MKVGAVEIPDPPDDAAQYHELAAWYSGYAYAESYRKIVISSCKEAIRAGWIPKRDGRMTEARLEAMAYLHDSYLDFLRRHLLGRIRFEKAFLANGGMR